MTGRYIPNLISSLRILLAVPLALLIARGQFGGALWLFALAAASDGLDGFIARRFGWTSRLGSILDPLGDKVLLATSYLTLGWRGNLPFWLALLVIGRDLVIVLGAVAYHYLISRYELVPTLASKTNTALQVLLVLAIVAHLALDLGPPSAISVLVWLVTLTTLASGLEYVLVWGRRACRVRCE